MTVRRLVYVCAIACMAGAVWCVPAGAVTGQIADPAGDVPLSFNRAVDITGVGVSFEGDTLRVSVTYKDQPPTTTFGLYVSQDDADQLDPRSTDCDSEAVESFTVGVTEATATLMVSGVDGKLTSPGTWDGLTVNYSFTSTALSRAWARTDPFVCVSGSADGDDFYGAFPGKVLKITPAMAKSAFARKLGGAYAASDHRMVTCPRSAFEKATDEYVARARCTFEFGGARSLHYGYGSVVLTFGVPEVVDFSSAQLTGAYRGCGTYGYAGSGKTSWWRGPVDGAQTSAWAKNVSCTAARRLALHWNGRGRFHGWTCRRLKNGYEYILARCTRPGGRAVRIEGGS